VLTGAIVDYACRCYGANEEQFSRIGNEDNYEEILSEFAYFIIVHERLQQ
jgi:hypothetical protein